MPVSSDGAWMHMPVSEFEALHAAANDAHERIQQAQGLAIEAQERCTRWQNRCEEAQAQVKALLEFIKEIGNEAHNRELDVVRLLRDHNEKL